jgi:hypothetical protein
MIQKLIHFIDERFKFQVERELQINSKNILE